MTLRLLRLPDDLLPLADMLVPSFRYPENPEWSVQIDEQEQVVDTVKNLRRIWPLIRAIQFVSPPLRDMFRGCVWDQAGQLVGVTLVQRRGTTDVWIVGTVGVLPAFRRQGIARKLVQAGLDLIRKHGGKKAWLNVIDGNLPAYTLYTSLGFEHYSGTSEFHLMPEQAPLAPVLPEGYTLSPQGHFEWQPRYELAERIVPEMLRKYEPVQVGRFREPAMMRLLWPLIIFSQGAREADFAIHTRAGQIVAYGGYTMQVRGQGPHQIRASLDPAHPELATWIVRCLLHQVVTSSPGHRVEFSVPQWMGDLAAAAEEAGFERRMTYCRMGLEL